MFDNLDITLDQPNRWHPMYDAVPWDQVPRAPEVIRGFCRHMPIREKNSHDLGSILIATEDRFHKQRRDVMRTNDHSDEIARWEAEKARLEAEEEAEAEGKVEPITPEAIEATKRLMVNPDLLDEPTVIPEEPTLCPTGKHWTAPRENIPSTPACDDIDITAELLVRSMDMVAAGEKVVPADMYEHEMSIADQRTLIEIIDECKTDCSRETRRNAIRADGSVVLGPKGKPRKVSELLDTPRDKEFSDQSEYIRQHYIKEHKYVRPLDGPLAIDVELIVPSQADKDRGYLPRSIIDTGMYQKYDVDNILKSILDAMDYRTKHADLVNGQHPKLGLIADDSCIRVATITRRERQEGEQCGFNYCISPYSLQGGLNDTTAQRAVGFDCRMDVARNARPDNDAWQERVAAGIDGKDRVRLQIATLATDRTPLDPEVARFWLAIRQRFGVDVATKLTLDAQSDIAFRRAMLEDVEPALMELTDIAEELVGDAWEDQERARIVDLLAVPLKVEEA